MRVVYCSVCMCKCMWYVVAIMWSVVWVVVAAMRAMWCEEIVRAAGMAPAGRRSESCESLDSVYNLVLAVS